jgi:hypothetical protein
MLLPTAMLLFPTVDFPLNDDWQYAYPVMTWVQDGQPAFKGVFAPNILLQVGWGYLFCEAAGSFGFRWLQWSTMTLAILALLFFSLLLELTGAGKLRHLFTGTMGLNPLFFSLSFTFMTDVPFLSFCLVSLYGWFRFTLAPSDHKWAALAVISALSSYGIRQPGLLLLPTYATIIWLLPVRRRLPKSLLLLSLTAAAYFGMEKILKPALDISDNFVPVGLLYFRTLLEQPVTVLAEWVRKSLKSIIYIGLFAIPLLPLTWPAIQKSGRLTPRFLLLTALSNGFLLTAMANQGKIFPFGGNILFNIGLGPELLADVYTLGLKNTPSLPIPLLLAIQLAGQLGATSFVVFLAVRWQACPAPLRPFLYTLVLLNALYLPALSITSFFDRYLLLPLASFLLIIAMLLRHNRSNTVRPARLLLLPFALFSCLATHDYLEWNRARKAAFLWLSDQGVSIRQMDAGYEYNGLYNYHRERADRTDTSFWWVTNNDWLISFGAVPGYLPVAAFPYQRWLVARQDRIFVQRKILPKDSLPIRSDQQP